jgi:pimeloyl-ACP methyl ester carboxylesterase
MRSPRPRLLLAIFATALICSSCAGATISSGQELVSFPTTDGAQIYADIYGHGTNAVVLAHGGRFNKKSWEAQARTLVDAGFVVLALDFRGYGESKGPGASDPQAAPLHLDILGAVQYLLAGGADSVGVIGGSMGGSAAAEAAAASGPEEISGLVLLASGAGEHPEVIRVPTLFVLARDDLEFDGTPRLVSIREDYEKVQAPKELVLLDGSAHAQYLFDTPQGPRAMAAIVAFLSKR